MRDVTPPFGLTELQGRAARSRFDFDTYLVLENNSVRAGCPPELVAGVLVLFDDETGATLTSNSFTLTPVGPGRVQSVSLRNLVQAAGGFSTTSARLVSASASFSASAPNIMGLNVQRASAQTGPVIIDTEAFATCP